MPTTRGPQQGMEIVLHEALKDEKHERYDCVGVGSLKKLMNPNECRKKQKVSPREA